ncbi:hypothetical protein [Sphingosinicella terrae]|jgi:hypothetical protein|uniref:hypothetical protein n=1 Tax=Sphingosinicella terrae TaxID=2172047 RepID=UPI000E0CFD02|nr:hypothetical protein [Sphingosinicella terrae]
MKTGRPGTGDRLVRALRSVLAADNDVMVEAEALESERWSSITFAGERHRLRLSIAGPGASEAADKLSATLADLDPDMPGQLLVEIGLAAREKVPDGSVRIVLNAVTVENG